MPDWQRGWRGYIYRPPPKPFLTTDYAHRAAQIERDKARQDKPKRRRQMSDNSVEWCEADGWENGHAFSTKDPEAEKIMRQHIQTKLRGYAPGPVYQDEQVVDEYYWICGPHKKEYGLFQRGNKKKEIPPKKDREYDPEYTANLEAQLAELRRIQAEVDAE